MIVLKRRICIFSCNFKYSFGGDLLLQTLICITLIIPDRQMDIVNPEIYFRLNIDNRCALLWIPNAYQDILMHICMPRLFFQCVFNDFQCILQDLSVALQSKNSPCNGDQN